MRLVISIILILLFLWGAVPELGLYLMLICFGLFFLFILILKVMGKLWENWIEYEFFSSFICLKCKHFL